jgi:arylsulfatase A-like enzyme
LDGVRAGRWKLVVKRDAQGQPIIGEYALYDLEKDVGETLDLADRHPDVVSDLKARMQVCREDLGDKWTGTPPGAACRPLGRVTNPRPLTTYAPDAPYIMAEYDLEDCG